MDVLLGLWTGPNGLADPWFGLHKLSLSWRELAFEFFQYPPRLKINRMIFIIFF